MWLRVRRSGGWERNGRAWRPRGWLAWLALMVWLAWLVWLGRLGGLEGLGNRETLCGTGELAEGNCEPCPLMSRCVDGRVEGCEGGRVLVGGTCVENSPAGRLTATLSHWIGKRLATANGLVECGEEPGKVVLLLKDVEAELGRRFGTSDSFRKAMKLLAADLSAGRTPGIEVSLNQNRAQVLSSQRANRSLLCRLTIAAARHRPLLFLASLAVLYLVLAATIFRPRRKLRSIARIFYTEALKQLHKKDDEAIDVKVFLARFAGDLKHDDREIVWKFADQFRKHDELVGVFYHSNDLFWVLI